MSGRNRSSRRDVRGNVDGRAQSRQVEHEVGVEESRQSGPDGGGDKAAGGELDASGLCQNSQDSLEN